MANQEHLDLLRQGVEAWNQWRLPRLWEVKPDLSGADLSSTNLSHLNLRGAVFYETNLRETNLSGAILGGANLSEADLSGANLSGAYLGGACLSDANLSGANFLGADLSGANLSRAILSRAILSGADLQEAAIWGTNLQEADLSRANLTEANLSGSDLSGANLTEANLSDANLRWAKLSGANLSRANLSGAYFKEAYLNDANMSETHLALTIFAFVNLQTVKGLDTLIHDGPSSVDVNSVVLPQGDVLKGFLRGTGFPDTLIDYLSQLNTSIRYPSCFISYSSKDELFARKLHASLQEHGVRCWLAPLGYYPRLDKSRRPRSKLILIFSEHAIQSLEHEVMVAWDKEYREQHLILFPLRLDGVVIDMEGKWPAFIRETRHISDFTRWKDHDAYQQALDRLLRDIKAEASKLEP